ncbi:unnamed protein product [Rhizophagus irregularis]|uniref:HMG box domain-containing protein n=4 Tax=Rhizophagus irregularis TaxID=588596 RepID=A0A916EIY1_9GLOM|nr:hypothetical protein GLOIN_2v1595641 [Rhizophagus irregularis DAOM 181602=DAOM 197198]UZO17625.1 hypothetical protein OCT59_008974 [Rhizophagus irregularis]POG72490.1 hypothetical protein GLOIN_2v1595641 [Rhizophagus irregularis DAOM 181602=DAOM 197198]CAB4392081.1 unnamed protein product [Rhizophagus irregularis]CAB4405091.1 unnamed protein product [Rhizophagus irregularis]CAB4474957.1 unnamed protein product [Rhizophagus irregularis]|eukprot:XP_025179356.1 hypothetical protein GLOIN_2v1595641 [Rhizophagus irregularis DAOM 181602=DAOM 197198]
MNPYETSSFQSPMIPESKIVEEVISEMDSLTYTKILQKITMPIEYLISPKRKSRKGNTPPRPQNSFLIYRRDFMSKLTTNYGPEISSNLSYVSSNAGKWWSSESQEVKNIYKLIADLAKKVHERTYPGYVFKPKKKRSHKPILNHDFDDDFLFASNTFNYQDAQRKFVPQLFNYHHPGFSSISTISTTSGSNSPTSQIYSSYNSNNSSSQLVLPSIDAILSESDNYDRFMCRSFQGP